MPQQSTLVMAGPTSTGLKLSPTLEKYCEAIYRLATSQKRPVKLVHLAAQMQVAGSTVFATLNRLQKNGLIEVSQHPHHVSLTPAGEEIAENLIRRHSLLENFLSNHLGLSREEVQTEAERLKHAISGQVEAALYRYLV
ncbi:MAG: metal-dependent transcriptional regulator [Chloroflexi bacterium]|nr:metal-dependent transcriptional regulator [Chloroflexota bacterium]